MLLAWRESAIKHNKKRSRLVQMNEIGTFFVISNSLNNQIFLVFDRRRLLE